MEKAEPLYNFISRIGLVWAMARVPCCHKEYGTLTYLSWVGQGKTTE
jgi:hypothetical protein